MKDPQKNRLYDWEDTWWGWDKSLITFPQSKSIIRKACKLYSVKPPTVVQHGGRELSFYQPDFHLISMQTNGGLNIPISLHEATHSIIWKTFGATVQDHGPEFLGVYLWLLQTFKVATFPVLLFSTQLAGLKHVEMLPSSLSHLQ